MPLKVVPDLLRVSHGVLAYLEDSAAELAITDAEAQVLSHLAAHGPSSTADLHRSLNQKRSTLTSILDRLVARGFITRVVREDDRRSFRVSLTAQGEAPAASLERSLEALEERALKSARKREVSAFRSVMTSLERALAPD
jgi:DNA-binding MarR family transcriptional regulator